MLNDLKIAIRRLRGSPGFAAVATLTLALAIGANTAVFSIADAVLFGPLPYEDAERVFVVQMLDQRTGSRYTRIDYSDMQLIAEHHGGIVGVGYFEPFGSLIVAGAGGAEVVSTAEVSANYFELLGARAARGRLFNAGDAGAGGRPAVLTWASFRQRFGGDEGIVGSAVTLGDATFDIIGVLPANFVFPSVFARDTEIIGLMGPLPADAGVFHPIVRLAPDVTVAQANAQIAALVSELAPRDAGQEAGVPALDPVRAVLYPTGRPVMRFLLAASALVLMIGCANLANMLLARTRLREREIGVQAALGASRAGLLRPLLIEAALMGVAGAAAALVVTSLAFDVLLRQVPPAAIGQAPVGVGGRVIVFALGLGVAGGLAFAVLPAWRASRLDALALIRGTSQTSGRRDAVGRPMLAAQVALAVVLVFGAVIAARAFVSVLQIPLGFDPDNVITVTVSPHVPDPEARRDTGSSYLQDFYARAVEALEARPGVVSAGAVGTVPFDSGAPEEAVVAVDTGERSPSGVFHVFPGYFETVGIDLVRGRLPTWDDLRSAAGVAVVAGSTARLLFGEQDPIGRAIGGSSGGRYVIIGVVGEVTRSIGREDWPPAYVIPGPEYFGIRTLVARARGRDEAILADVRRQIGAMAPGAPVTARWWSDSISSVTAYRNPRFQTLVLGSFASLALGLTALGVFGLVAFLVASRRRELGIRMAIGATPASLIGLTLAKALAPTLAGVALGLLATRWLGRLAEAQLYEVDTGDPATLALAVAAVTVAALLAAYLPARRAARIDPMAVLRRE